MTLKKIFWFVLIFTLIVWVGVGIYYLKSSPSSPAPVTSSPKVTAVPTLEPTEPPVAEYLDETHFIVGNFQGWEEIQNSKDRYILLTHPQTGNPFPKIRVGFEFSRLFGYAGRKDITVFAVEKNEREYDVLWALKYFSDEEIDKLIKKGDYIKVFLKKNLTDKNGNPLATWLMIKRMGGKQEVEKELGREVQKPEVEKQ